MRILAFNSRSLRPAALALRIVLGLCLALGATACATTAVQTASGAWHEVRSPRFRAWTDSDPAEAAALLRDLELFHRVVLKVTSASDQEGALPLLIWIARDEATFRAWTGQDLAGVFTSTMLGNLAVVTSQAAHAPKDGEVTSRHILFHEYTHHLVAQSGARVPSWYDEGFAEYLGATEITPEGAYRIGCPPRYRTRWAKYVEWLPIQRVMEAPSIIALAQGRHSFRGGRGIADPYAQSWYAVHYFNQNAERRDQLARYLELTGSGTPSARAVEASFGMSYGELDATLRTHSAQEAFDCRELLFSDAAEPVEPEVVPISKAEAHYRVAQLLLTSFGDVNGAREALEQTLTLEPRHAGASAALARVHLRLAEARSGEGGDPSAEIARATQYLKAARAVEPRQAEALAIEGHLGFLDAQRADERGDKTAALSAVRAARGAYRRAVHLDTSLAEALLGLGLTYFMLDDGSEEAQVAFEGAAYLLPLNVGIPIALAKLHLARKQPKLAMAPLEHAQRWARTDEERAKVRALLEQAQSAQP